MVFLPLICLSLGIVFAVVSRRKGDRRMMAFAISLLLAAMGTGIITFFALNTLK